MEKNKGSEGETASVDTPPSSETGETNDKESGVLDKDCNIKRKQSPEDNSEIKTKRQKSEEQEPLVSPPPGQETLQESSNRPARVPSSVKRKGSTSNFQNVVAFLKKCLAEEKCDFYKAFTFEHFETLKQHWMKVPVEKEIWSWEKWTLKEDDASTWPKLTDLPPFLHADTIDPVKYHDHKPCKGKYEVLPNGLPKSYAPRPDGPCKVS